MGSWDTMTQTGIDTIHTTILNCPSGLCSFFLANPNHRGNLSYASSFISLDVESIDHFSAYYRRTNQTKRCNFSDCNTSSTPHKRIPVPVPEHREIAVLIEFQSVDILSLDLPFFFVAVMVLLPPGTKVRFFSVPDNI